MLAVREARDRPTHLLQLQSKGLEADDGRDKLLLVALDALDGDDALCELVGLFRLGGLGLGRLLLGVLGGALLCLDGEGSGGGFEGLCDISVFGQTDMLSDMLWESRGEERGGRDEPADQIRSYISLWWLSSHSWHFLTVPPYSQYCKPDEGYWSASWGRVAHSERALARDPGGWFTPLEAACRLDRGTRKDVSWAKLFLAARG